MNTRLLVKWIARYKNTAVQGYWKDILRLKYHNVINKIK
jgi:hypothetical protein